MTATRVTRDPGENVYDCPPDVVVTKAVYLSGENEVDLADNGSASTCDAFGVVISKPSTTRAIVRSLGPADVFSGLTPQTTYYVGAAGELAASPPETGIVQQLGKAVTATVLHVAIKPRVIL